MNSLSLYKSVLVLCVTFAGSISVVHAQEQWHYTALGDSIASGYTTPAGYVPTFRDYIQTDAGVSVVLYNLGQNGATSLSLLNSIRTDSVFQNAILQSEVITWNIGIVDLMNARNSYKNKKCGGTDNQDCLRSAVTKFKTNWDGIISEILIRRGITYTIIRTMDIYNPWVATDKEKTQHQTSQRRQSRAMIFRFLSTTLIRSMLTSQPPRLTIKFPARMCILRSMEVMETKIRLRRAI